MTRMVDPDGLRGAGTDLQDISDRFLTELRAFLGDLQGFGAPWGNDDIGSLIGAACEEVTAYAADASSPRSRNSAWSASTSTGWRTSSRRTSGPSRSA